MDRYIRVSELDRAGLPIRASTAYKWHCLGRFPSIFRKLGGILLLDIVALEALISGGKKN